MTSLLTDKQTKDMHNAIRAYLSSQGEMFHETLACFEREDSHCVEGEAIPSRSHKLLCRKWTSVVRLQRKVMELEGKLKQSQEDLKQAGKGGSVGGKSGVGSSGGLTLPREPSKSTLEGHRGPITCVAMHPTFNLVVSSSEDASIKVWDHESGEFEQTLKGHTNSVNCLCFDSSGETLASCSSDLSIKLWDFKDEFKCRKTLTGHEHTVSGVCFVPSSEHLVSCSRDMSIRIWELSTGYCVHSHVNGHGDWIRSIDVSPNGEMLASCSSDQTAKVWRLETMGTTSATVTEIVALRDHDHVVECVSFSNAAADLTLRKLMRVNGGGSSLIAGGGGSGGSSGSGGGSGGDGGDGGVVVDVGSGAGDGGETKGDSSTGSQKQERRNVGGQFVVTGSRDRTVRVWHVATGMSVCVFREHENWVRDVKFHVRGHVVLSVAEDRTIRAFDLLEGRKAIRTITDAHSHFLTSFDIHSNGTSMVTGSIDKTLRCWSMK